MRLVDFLPYMKSLLNVVRKLIVSYCVSPPIVIKLTIVPNPSLRGI